MQRKADQILISNLELRTCIGATETERSQPQRILASITLEPMTGFAGINDRLDRTVDYDTAAQAVKALASTGRRVLVETLAEEIAALLMRRFRLAAVEVELRKFILPDTEFVGVRIRRER
ncbi:MAG: dihydroneopterin aldolase [Chthoniobacteraceae bacterium]